MKDPKLFVFSLLVLLAATCNLRAQSAVPDCDEIKVEVKTVAPINNQSNGSIDLIFSKAIDSYKIFLLNAGSDRTRKEEIVGGRITSLKPGFFDFLIIDKTKKGCVKQLTVVLK
jgi:hypothetical protein